MTLLKKYRINNDLVQKEMADKLNISLPAYRNYEIGKRVLPPEILLRFLKLRNYPSEEKLIKVLEELYGKE